jgi:hypothetical protein
MVLLAIMLFMSGAAFAQDVEVTLGNKSARFMYITEAFGQDFGRLEMEAGFLYTESNDKLVNLGLLVRGESVSVPMVVSLGARAYFARLKTYTVGAVAIGGDLLFNPELWGGFGVGANYYVAPGVVSFRDAKDLTEYGAYLNYQITQQAQVSLGFRTIEVKIKNGVGNLQLDNGGYFGLNLSF